MTDKRKKDVDWGIRDNADGTVPYEGAQLAVLMDLRDELKKLNRLLHCPNFIGMPRYLQKVAANTNNLPKKKRARKTPRK